MLSWGFPKLLVCKYWLLSSLGKCINSAVLILSNQILFVSSVSTSLTLVCTCAYKQQPLLSRKEKKTKKDKGLCFIAYTFWLLPSQHLEFWPNKKKRKMSSYQRLNILSQFLWLFQWLVYDFIGFSRSGRAASRHKLTVQNITVSFDIHLFIIDILLIIGFSRQRCVDSGLFLALTLLNVEAFRIPHSAFRWSRI